MEHVTGHEGALEPDTKDWARVPERPCAERWLGVLATRR
jgi:hypothetical protein